MADGLKKGKVIPLASVFPAEEAQKAVKRVEDSITDRQIELEHLLRFISDNSVIVNLVQKLPDELTYDIMVPFGKAAFFPGRLIHTNELLVLLGDGYYAQRTSKQTIEILRRRGKVLESQVDSLKAMMSDLKAEASFFDATASEAAEGLVEIREEYIEEHPTKMESELGSSQSENMKVKVDEEEYARIMARLDELEEEELAASRSDEDDEENTDTQYSEHQLKDQMKEYAKLYNTTQPLHGSYSQPNESLNGKSSADDMLKSNLKEKSLVFPESKEKALVMPAPEPEKVQATLTPKVEESVHSVMDHNSKVVASQRKAFTGSIVEHSHGIASNLTSESTSSQVHSSSPSKPVSRFKMQKGSR